MKNGLGGFLLVVLGISMLLACSIPEQNIVVSEPDVLQNISDNAVRDSSCLVYNLGSDYNWDITTTPVNGEVRFIYSLDILAHNDSNAHNYFEVKIFIYSVDDNARSVEIERLRVMGLELQEKDSYLDRHLYAVLSGDQLCNFPANPEYGYVISWDDTKDVKIPSQNDLVKSLLVPEIINLGEEYNRIDGNEPSGGEVKYAEKMLDMIQNPKNEESLFDVSVKIYVSEGYSLQEETERLAGYEIFFNETDGKGYTLLTGKQLKNFPADSRCGYEIFWDEYTKVRLPEAE